MSHVRLMFIFFFFRRQNENDDETPARVRNQFISDEAVSVSLIFVFPLFNSRHLSTQEEDSEPRDEERGSATLSDGGSDEEGEEAGSGSEEEQDEEIPVSVRMRLVSPF